MQDSQAEDAVSEEQEEEEEEDESESDEDDVQITIDTIQPMPIPYGRSSSHQRMTIPPGGRKPYLTLRGRAREELVSKRMTIPPRGKKP